MDAHKIDLILEQVRDLRHDLQTLRTEMHGEFAHIKEQLSRLSAGLGSLGHPRTHPDAHSPPSPT